MSEKETRKLPSQEISLFLLANSDPILRSNFSSSVEGPDHRPSPSPFSPARQIVTPFPPPLLSLSAHAASFIVIVPRPFEAPEIINVSKGSLSSSSPHTNPAWEKRKGGGLFQSIKGTNKTLEKRGERDPFNGRKGRRRRRCSHHPTNQPLSQDILLDP